MAPLSQCSTSPESMAFSPNVTGARIKSMINLFRNNEWEDGTRIVATRQLHELSAAGTDPGQWEVVMWPRGANGWRGMRQRRCWVYDEKKQWHPLCPLVSRQVPTCSFLLPGLMRTSMREVKPGMRYFSFFLFFFPSYLYAPGWFNLFVSSCRHLFVAVSSSCLCRHTYLWLHEDYRWLICFKLVKFSASFFWLHLSVNFLTFLLLSVDDVDADDGDDDDD